jgi:predicted phosphodiesterase
VLRLLALSKRFDSSIAFISDVHGNALALDAVLDDIDQRGIRTIINLGDVVGYGPNPEECLDLVMEHCTYNLCGNHEYAVMNSAEGFNPVARGAVDFVRGRLKPTAEDAENSERQIRWQFIESLAPAYHDTDFMAMHGSPRHYVTEYVLPSDPEIDPLKLDDIFAVMPCKVAFVGHTHFPGVIEDGALSFVSTRDLDDVYVLHDDIKAVVNVGSVGQPRDRDVRSCYVEFDGETVWFRRVSYDVEETVTRIKESGGLHESLGLRLLEGR